jgi:hypothetical protein
MGRMTMEPAKDVFGCGSPQGEKALSVADLLRRWLSSARRAQLEEAFRADA